MDLLLSSLAKEKDHGAVRASLPNLEDYGPVAQLVRAHP